MSKILFPKKIQNLFYSSTISNTSENIEESVLPTFDPNSTKFLGPQDKALFYTIAMLLGLIS